MVLVKPGDLAASWLAHKLVGDQCAFSDHCVRGDCGDEMPGFCQSLSARDIETILEWIRQGADASRACATGG
jgi:hypothetical protein